MPTIATRADFLSADFSVRLPAPNGDPKSWWYWVTICGNDQGQWVARVKHKISGMESPADVDEVPISEISIDSAVRVARSIAERTLAPPVKRRGRQHPEVSSLERSTWIVTLQGADKAGRERQLDVVISPGPMQLGLDEWRPEPYTAQVRRRTAAANAPWYCVPCNGMSPQNAGEAAAFACDSGSIRWG